MSNVVVFPTRSSSTYGHVVPSERVLTPAQRLEIWEAFHLGHVTVQRLQAQYRVRRSEIENSIRIKTMKAAA